MPVIRKLPAAHEFTRACRVAGALEFVSCNMRPDIMVVRRERQGCFGMSTGGFAVLDEYGHVDEIGNSTGIAWLELVRLQHRAIGVVV